MHSQMFFFVVFNRGGEGENPYQVFFFCSLCATEEIYLHFLSQRRNKKEYHKKGGIGEFGTLNEAMAGYGHVPPSLSL